jgi:SAM-dependent methyltransferase
MQAESFDSYAADYDAHFTFSPIGQLQRERVFHFLDPYLKVPRLVLEFNCGTGHDAIELAKRGHTVTALDISQGMIEVAKAKTKSSNPEFVCADMRKFSELNIPKVDVLFSNFGGWNCLNEVELKQMAMACQQQLNDNGLIAAVIMGTQCKWEDFYFKRIKHKGYKRRQNINGISTTINGNTFTTYYYSPQQLTYYFKKEFSVELLKPIGLFVPPSYLNDYFKRKPLALKLLSLLEKVFGGISSWADYADHYLIVLRKKSN